MSKMMQFPEAMRLEVAKAIHADWCEKPWDEASEADREDSRRSARAALAVVERYLGPALSGLEQFFAREGEGANERFERLADVFHRETGYLAPGKDCRVDDYEVRKAAHEVWMAGILANARQFLHQPAEEPEPCPDCDGTGERPGMFNARGELDYLDGTPNGRMVECQTCGGTGELS